MVATERMTKVRSWGPEFDLFLLSGRQWRREHRIAHAKYLLSRAEQAGPAFAVEQEFYGAVLDALGVPGPVPQPGDSNG